MHDVVAAPNYQANLFVNVPATPPQVVTLYLHVDGYPRAFVYRVQCSAQTTDLPEKTDFGLSTDSQAGLAGISTAGAVTPLEAQIDAPVGTFESGIDSVRVALDENMDGQTSGRKRGFVIRSIAKSTCLSPRSARAYWRWTLE